MSSVMQRWAKRVRGVLRLHSRSEPLRAPDETAYGPAGSTPLVYLQFFLDLPLDAGISQGYGFNAIEFSEPPIKDWSEFDLQAFLGMPALPQPGVRPCTSLRFFRVVNEARPPFANIEKALGNEFPEGLPTSQQLPVVHESHSVVVATRIVPRRSIDFGNEWLHEQFTTVLAKLNEQLLALGAAADDHSIGPITERQLPPMVLGLQGDMRNVRAGRIRKLASFFLLIGHAGGVREADHDASVINYALAIADRGGQGPFFPTMELMFAARRSFDAGLLAQTVLETGTAIELLVNSVVLGIEVEKGSSQERIENLLENTGFQNLIRDHLAPRLGVIVDKQRSGNDPVSTWLRVAYKLRNQVAHRGHKPTLHETLETLRLADELMHFVAETAQERSGFGIEFPGLDELEHAPQLDDRSLAIEDASSTRLAAREAFHRGVDARHGGDLDTAHAAFAEADAKGSPGGSFNVAWLALMDGDDVTATAALRRATDRGHPVAPAYLGVQHLRDGDEGSAEAALLLAPAGHPVAGPLAAYFLAIIASNRNDLERAVQFYKDASVFDNFEHAGEAAFRRGTILEELGDADAAEAYERGAELGNAKVASNLANLHRHRGAVEAATRAYTRALELSDATTEGLIAFNFANMLDEHGRVEEAKPIYQRAGAAGEPWSHVRLAGLAAEAGLLHAAADHLRTSRRSGIPAVEQAAATLALDFGLKLGEADTQSPP